MAIDLTSRITEDERLLLNRTRELYERADKGSVSTTQFLNLRERFIIENMMSGLFSSDESEPLCFFYGGHTDAERTVLFCLPAFYRYTCDAACPWTALADELPRVITPLRIKSSGYVKLSHRDYLGALIGLGIDRSAMGDILLDEEGAILFASPSVASLLKSEPVYIGRDKAKVVDISLPDDFSYVREFENVRGTVASARLDAVLSEIARTSRERAKELIKQGLVEHNHFTAAEPDASVTDGDIISVRKVTGTKGGKFIIDSITEHSNKGRIRLEARKYL